MRGVFDSDGGTKTVEKPDKRIGGNFVYLNMKSRKFVRDVYKMVLDDFDVDFFKPNPNGAEGGWKTGTGSREAVKVLSRQKIFIHPVKRWMLWKLSSIVS